MMPILITDQLINEYPESIRQLLLKRLMRATDTVPPMVIITTEDLAGFSVGIRRDIAHMLRHASGMQITRPDDWAGEWTESEIRNRLAQSPR